MGTARTRPAPIPPRARPPRAVSAFMATGIEPVADEWDALAGRCGASPFLRPGWIAAWCEAFASEPAEVLSVRRGGELVAAMPVLRARRRLRSPTNWETPEFGMVAADEDAAAALLAGALDRRPWYLSLAYLDADGVTARVSARAAESLGYDAHRLPQMRSPLADVSDGWEALERRLSKSRRGDLRRRRRRLEERGTLSFEVTGGRERMGPLLAEAFRLEAAGWKGRQGTAMASDPAVRRFYADVARWAADRGWLRIAFLRLDGRPIAFSLSLSEGRDHYLLKTAYDEELRSLGPGMLQVAEMIRDAVASGVRTCHFLGTDEPWKTEWADGSAERVRHVLVPSSRATRRLAPALAGGASRLPAPARAVMRRFLA